MQVNRVKSEQIKEIFHKLLEEKSLNKKSSVSASSVAIPVEGTVGLTFSNFV
jgi:hypothetical protein